MQEEHIGNVVDMVVSVTDNSSKSKVYGVLTIYKHYGQYCGS